MKKLKKICVVTGTRAEYGLLSGLMKLIRADQDLELQLIATCMHLSNEHGQTYREIENDGFQISKKIDMLLNNDSPSAISSSSGLGSIGFGAAFAELQPDLIVLLGDRFELLSAASSALFFNIPIAHLHGGEITEGAIDDSIRHAVTKMARFHFCATEDYRNRIVQMGEDPQYVFNVGGFGVDSLKAAELYSKAEVESRLNTKFEKKNLLITYHPETAQNNTAHRFAELLDALQIVMKDTKIFFTMPNADTGGSAIRDQIDQFVKRNPERSFAYQNLGHKLYLSTVQFIDAVVGNSSSGLLEVPTFLKGTINIGDRQKGRALSESVICCPSEKDKIIDALTLLYSQGFQAKLKTAKNPYGVGGASKKTLSILKEKYSSLESRKKFVDLPMTQ